MTFFHLGHFLNNYWSYSSDTWHNSRVLKQNLGQLDQFDLSLMVILDGHFMAAHFVCVEVLQPIQPNGVMSCVVSLPNHTSTEQD